MLSAAAAAAELEGYLQSMLALKPPGVSGSKIHGITTLCTASVENESVLIQRIFTHFKKAPGTHKLGVLYVVDSVTRQWAEAARKADQPLGRATPEGTCAAGVNRVTQLLPALMTDIINNAPQDQKEKIKKLIDIWECACTFPLSMLTSFREKLSTQPQNVKSPAPSQAPSFHSLGAPTPQEPANASFASAPDTTSILKSLADMAKQNMAAPSVLAPSADSPSLQPSAANLYAAAASAMASPFGTLGGLGQDLAMPQLQSQSQTLNPLAAMLPRAASAAPARDGNALPQLLQLLQFLSQQGIPQDQVGEALQLLNLTNSTGAANPAQLPRFGTIPSQGAGGGGRPDEQNRDDSDRERDRDNARAPPVYREYHNDFSGRRGDPRDAHGGRRGNEYRQRSPPDRRRWSPPPQRKDPSLPLPGPKLVEWDYSIGQGNIKVLSRTLFVGGVASSDAHLRTLFNKFGVVQTCIVNINKGHAFIKMISRQDAVSAREGIESFRSGEMQLRARWGVGFGPRDCNNYQTGISVIPIERLTEADRKWMLTAEYGGTGGRPIESGMVVEEPDIEIGAGISSKAVSRRIAIDSDDGIDSVSSRGRNSDRFGGGVGRGGRPDRDGFPNRDHLHRN